MTAERILKLPDLVSAESPKIDNHHFEDLTIVGPAVVNATDVRFKDCVFSYGDHGPEAMFWEVDDDKTVAIGHIEITNSTFTRCRFVGIGWAGNHDLLHQLASISRVSD